MKTSTNASIVKEKDYCVGFVLVRADSPKIPDSSS